MKMRLLLSLAVLPLCALFGSFSAADDGDFSMGIEGGLAYADLGAENTAQTIANVTGQTTTYEYDLATWVGRISGRYQFIEMVGAEIGVFYTGDLDVTYTIPGASQTEAYSAWGLDGALVIKDPKFPVFGKIGLHQTEVDGTRTIIIGSNTVSIADSASGAGILVGIGYEASKQPWSVTLTYYNNVGGVDEADVTMLNFGYRFDFQ